MGSETPRNVLDRFGGNDRYSHIDGMLWQCSTQGSDEFHLSGIIYFRPIVSAWCHHSQFQLGWGMSFMIRFLHACFHHCGVILGSSCGWYNGSSLSRPYTFRFPIKMGFHRYGWSFVRGRYNFDAVRNHRYLLPRKNNHNRLCKCRCSFVQYLFDLWHSTDDGRWAQVQHKPRGVHFCSTEPVSGYYQHLYVYSYNHWRVARLNALVLCDSAYQTVIPTINKLAEKLSIAYIITTWNVLSMIKIFLMVFILSRAIYICCYQPYSFTPANVTCSNIYMKKRNDAPVCNGLNRTILLHY